MTGCKIKLSIVIVFKVIISILNKAPASNGRQTTVDVQCMSGDNCGTFSAISARSPEKKK